jgi:hypothetical protein
MFDTTLLSTVKFAFDSLDDIRVGERLLLMLLHRPTSTEILRGSGGISTYIQRLGPRFVRSWIGSLLRKAIG